MTGPDPIGELLEQQQADDPNVRREAAARLLIYAWSQLREAGGIADDRLRGWVVENMREQIISLTPARPGRPDQSDKKRDIALQVEMAQLPVGDDDPPWAARGKSKADAIAHVAKTNHLSPDTVETYHKKFGKSVRELLRHYSPSGHSSD